MAEYDLTQTIIPYCDRHLVFPLLAHLVDNELFPGEQVQAAQYELAKGTNMVDFSISLFEQLNPNKEVPAGAHIYEVFNIRELIEYLRIREQARERRIHE